jgi:hypothetical protein
VVSIDYYTNNMEKAENLRLFRQKLDTCGGIKTTTLSGEIVLIVLSCSPKPVGTAVAHEK